MKDEDKKTIEALIEEHDKIAQASLDLEHQRLALSEKLLALKKNNQDLVTNLSTTTPINGVYYSLRVRKGTIGEIAYLCACHEPFGSWRKKKK
jgi:altronate dehydratase